MDIASIKFNNWHNITFDVNWIAVIIIIIAVFAVVFTIKARAGELGKKSISINEIKLGIGNNNITIKYEQKDREIAYKLWVELSTRKIGILFDEENDVISEVYNSWYEFFGIARELLKDIPPNRVTHSNELLSLTEKVLNAGLRPHLTKWQAKFRRWFENESNGNCKNSPQEIQRTYCEYEALVKDLKKTNEQMIEYKKLMSEIAFK